MMEIGGGNISKASSKHHQLSPSYSKCQNENISALVNVLDAYVSFNSETVQLQNIITGELYSKEIFESLIVVEQLGNNLSDEFVKERMQPENEKSIFGPIKRSSVKTFTSSNKSLKLKVDDKVIDLKENCNLFARCALVKDKRNIDMRTVIGEHELTNFPLSLLNPDGSLLIVVLVNQALLTWF